jgi:hypothetical protein
MKKERTRFSQATEAKVVGTTVSHVICHLYFYIIRLSATRSSNSQPTHQLAPKALRAAV